MPGMQKLLPTVLMYFVLLLAVLPTCATAQSIASATPNTGMFGAAVPITITGNGTSFHISAGIAEAWIQQGTDIIPILLNDPVYDTLLTGSLLTGCSPNAGQYDVYYRDTDPGTPYDTLFATNAFQITGTAIQPSFSPSAGLIGDTIAFALAGCGNFAAAPNDAIHRAWLDDGTNIVPLDTVIGNSSDEATGSLAIPCDLPAGAYSLFYSINDTVANTIDTVALSGSITLSAEYSPLEAQLGQALSVNFTGIGNSFSMGTSTLNEAWLQLGVDQINMTNVTAPGMNQWQGDVTIPGASEGGYWDVYYRQENTVTTLVDTTRALCPMKICLTANCDFVWPGDANYDGVVNNFDILPIGQGFGFTGPARTNTSILWEGFAAANWVNTFPSGINYKHGDADGNGTIDYPDTVAVANNYTFVHYKGGHFTDVVNGGAPPLSIHIENAVDSMSLGDTVRTRIELGSSAVPSNDTYGIAFTINFPPELMDENSLYFKSEGGWLGDEGVNKIKFHKVNYASGRIEATVTRIDQTAISGNGKIAEFGGATADNLSGKSPNLLELLKLSIGEVALVDEGGSEMPYSTLSDSIVVVNTPQEPEAESNNPLGLSIYPNPAKEVLTVRTTAGIPIEKLILFDALGRVVYTTQPNTHLVRLNMNTIPEGMYLIETRTATKRTVRRVTIVH